MKVYCIIVGAAILLDILTGLVKAWYQSDFQSCRMREGLFHKGGELLVLALLYGVEYAAPLVGIETGLPAFRVGAGYVVLMELGSIIENIRAFTPGLDRILGKDKESDNNA